MALTGICAMCEKGNYIRGIQNTLHKRTDRNYYKRTFGMESNWTNYRKPFAFTDQVLRSATSFMPRKRLVCEQEEILSTSMSFFTLITQDDPPVRSESNPVIDSRVAHDIDGPILPGLPDDVAKYCLALVPRRYLPAMGSVCKKWRSFLKSQEFITVRKLAGLLEEWLYVLTMDSEGKESHWVVLDSLGRKRQLLPPMPGPTMAGFGVVVVNEKLLVMAGYSVIDGTGTASADVYEYDCCLNSWSKLSSMRVARYDFACAEVNGKIYAAGGYGMDGDSLSSVEMYDPDSNTWTMIESLRRPRWGCFACGFDGKLYVMGGRSSFSIGNSRSVDVYNPERHTWREMKNGCVMVTAHAVLGKKLFCMEWKNQRRLAIFNPEDGSRKTVAVPMTGSSSIGFCFGILGGKLVLFSVQDEPGYRTLLYDPSASPGSEWCTSEIKPSGCCLCCVTIKS